jgi:hypothetical protein
MCAMNRVMPFLLLALAPLLSACSDDAPAPAPASPSTIAIEAPDVGGPATSAHCRARPRRPLSSRERCEMDAYAANCTPAADCMVRCIASPDAVTVGGGCEHVCAPGANPWASLPPKPEGCG